MTWTPPLGLTVLFVSVANAPGLDKVLMAGILAGLTATILGGWLWYKRGK